MQQLQIPPLAEGERYIGCIGDATGNLHHVVLLPGDNDDATWEAQMEWAKSIGGDLPNRIEQAMLWATYRDQFKKDWYWSNETYHSESGWAWSQYFGNGSQDSRRKVNAVRARAVRRIERAGTYHNALDDARHQARQLQAVTQAGLANDAYAAQAKRLAMELECLLLSCKDTAAVSAWWDSAHEALEAFQNIGREVACNWNESGARGYMSRDMQSHRSRRFPGGTARGPHHDKPDE